MYITSLSKDSFLLKFKQKSIIFSNSDLKFPKAESVDMGIAKNCSGFNGLCINNPGEYEMGGLYISTRSYDIKKINEKGMAHLLVDENLKVGVLTHFILKPPDTIKSFLMDTDILFVPLEKDMDATPQKAFAMAISLSPKIIIPFGYLDSTMIKKFVANARDTVKCKKSKLFTKKDFTEIGVVAVFE